MPKNTITKINEIIEALNELKVDCEREESKGEIISAEGVKVKAIEKFIKEGAEVLGKEEKRFLFGEELKGEGWKSFEYDTGKAGFFADKSEIEKLNVLGVKVGSEDETTKSLKKELETMERLLEKKDAEIERLQKQLEKQEDKTQVNFQSVIEMMAKSAPTPYDKQ